MSTPGAAPPGSDAGGDSRSWMRVSNSFVAVTSRKRWIVSVPAVPFGGATRMLTLIQTGVPAFVRVGMSRVWMGWPILTSVIT